jgi:LmbE family N-acetylglucosaminyl deacetylase
VTRIRNEEDKRFCKLLGLKFLSLDHKDCLLRTGKTILSPKGSIDVEQVSSLAFEIADVIKHHSIQNIFTHFPSGPQQHIDHRLVFHAACGVKKQLPIKLYLVDDFPYSRVMDPKRKGLRILDEITIVDLQEKFAAMNIYASQMCKLFFLQVTKLSDQNRGSERILVSLDAVLPPSHRI